MLSGRRRSRAGANEDLMRTPPPHAAPGGGLGGRLAVIAAVALGATTVYFALQARAARAELRAASAAHDDGEAPGSPRSGAAAPLAAGSAGDRELARLRSENQALRARLAAAVAAAAAGEGDPPAPERPAGDAGARAHDDRRGQPRADLEGQQGASGPLAARGEALQEGERTPRSQKEAELVSQMASAAQQLRDIADKIQAARQLPEDERQATLAALRQQGWDAYGQLAALKGQDRQMQLEALAAQSGISPDNAAGFASQVGQVVKDTQPPRPPRSLGPPPGRQGGGSGS
jgi:hypothetical protein